MQTAASGRNTLLGIHAANGENPVSEDSAWHVVLSAYQAGQAWPFSIFGATYRELQSAGELELIGGAETMTLLSEYYDNGAFQYAFVAPPSEYRDMIRGRLPFALARYIATSCEVSQTTNTQALVPCEEPAHSENLLSIVEELQLDRTILSSLRTHMSRVRVQLEILSELSTEAQELIEHLGHS